MAEKHRLICWVHLEGPFEDMRGCRRSLTVFITVTLFCCAVAFAIGWFLALATGR